MSYINENPLFKSPSTAIAAPTSAGDYHLQPDSPCINQGTNYIWNLPDMVFPGDDIDGDSRPIGSDYDIGSDEVTCPGDGSANGSFRSCSIDGGVCVLTGLQFCGAGTWGPCVTLQEECDNLDNDCDGLTDEGCDDDGDDYCDATMGYSESQGVPVACPNGPGDCTRLIR